MTLNISNSDITKINYLTNRHGYNTLLQTKSINLSPCRSGRGYIYYMDLLWDEVKNSTLFVPTGLDYPYDITLIEYAERDAIDLQLLLNFKVNNSQVFDSNQILDNIL